MKISVLMPVYLTQLDWLQLAVDSIVNQTYRDFNFIIVDDNNPPGETRDYLYSLTKRDCCVHLIRRTKNEGLAAALNEGLKHCTGDLIVRMDSDDIARPELLEKHNAFFETFPDRHICGVQIRLFNEEREWFSHHPELVTKRYASSDLAGYWFVNQPGIAFRRDAIEALGGYGQVPPTCAEDYALWIKFLRAGYLIYNRPEILMDYRVHPKSFSFAPDRKAPIWHEFLHNQKKSLYE
jgi:glycosyltransferase EpsE